MKIGILTLPLHSNYGGNLQAFALMHVLKGLGHDVWLVNRGNDRRPLWRTPLVFIKRFFQRYMLGRKGVALLPQWEKNAIEVHSRQFIAQHIQPQTELFRGHDELRKGVPKYGFDAMVVGSDQVWRRQYAPSIEDNFFGFLDSQSEVRRISYAASFGTDQWECNASQTSNCRALIARFKAVSVREDFGVTLCREHLGVDAVHVLDPTMLLDVGDYLDLLPEGRAAPTVGRGVLEYVLDMDPKKKALVNSISDRMGVDAFAVNGRKEDKTAQLSARVAPPVEDWLRGFRDASFVITDSFHACVFAILFKKPFIAIGNQSRGLSRFQSLLGMFGLNERLLTDTSNIDIESYMQPIDWHSVDQLLDVKKVASLAYLRTATV